MNRLILLTTLLLSHFSYAAPTPEVLAALTSEEESGIAAVLVENVTSTKVARGEFYSSVSLITVYTGPVLAPYKTYLKVFDPLPQEGGDYGSFKVFAVTHMQDGFPKNVKAEFARDGKAIFVGYDVRYLEKLDDRGEAVFKRGRFIAKIGVVSPVAEGALADQAEFTIRK